MAERLSGEQVEAWANAIEGREDIGLDQRDIDLAHALHWLANPELEGRLDRSVAAELLARLESGPGVTHDRSIDLYAECSVAS